MRLRLSLLISLLAAAVPATARADFFPGEPIDGPSADVRSLGDVDVARDGSGALAYVKRDGGDRPRLRLAPGQRRVAAARARRRGDRRRRRRPGRRRGRRRRARGRLRQRGQPARGAAPGRRDRRSPPPALVATGGHSPAIDMSIKGAAYLSFTARQRRAGRAAGREAPGVQRPRRRARRRPRAQRGRRRRQALEGRDLRRRHRRGDLGARTAPTAAPTSTRAACSTAASRPRRRTSPSTSSPATPAPAPTRPTSTSRTTRRSPGSPSARRSPTAARTRSRAASWAPRSRRPSRSTASASRRARPPRARACGINGRGAGVATSGGTTGFEAFAAVFDEDGTFAPIAGLDPGNTVAPFTLGGIAETGDAVVAWQQRQRRCSATAPCRARFIDNRPGSKDRYAGPDRAALRTRPRLGRREPRVRRGLQPRGRRRRRLRPGGRGRPHHRLGAPTTGRPGSSAGTPRPSTAGSRARG